MTIEKNGKLCKCGKLGCFESYASMKVLKDNLRKKLGYDEKTSGQELLNIIRETKKINDKDKLKKIEETINEYIEYLNIGLTNLINIFEPEGIGIGGSFVYFEEIILQRLKNKILEPKNLFNPRKNIEIEKAILGNDAGIIGSVLAN